MKTKSQYLFIALIFIAAVHVSTAGGTRFFRIAGPAVTTITEFRPDGLLVWSNSQPGAAYTIQAVSSLPSGTNWTDFIKIASADAVNTNLLADFNSSFALALIPAGAFTMGDSLDNIENAWPVLSVTVSGFYMDVNLVSYNQWLSVYNWATNHGYSFDNSGSGKAANHPVFNVNWYDVVKWCNARSQQAGLTPVYYSDSGLTQVYTNGQVTNVCANWSASGYRLPTEAEWEKAARGGLNQQRFPWGNTISESQANYYGNTNLDSYDLGPNGYNTNFYYGNPPYTSPVGSLAANGYGLYDMAGNLFEWCWDWYDTFYHFGNVDPHGPDSSPFAPIKGWRMLRSGSWLYYARVSRCAYRTSNWVYPSGANNNIGFRCVRKI